MYQILINVLLNLYRKFKFLPLLNGIKSGFLSSGPCGEFRLGRFAFWFFNEGIVTVKENYNVFWIITTKTGLTSRIFSIKRPLRSRISTLITCSATMGCYVNVNNVTS